MGRKPLFIGVALVAVVAIVAAVAVFQPHKLFIDDVVDEARPDEIATPTTGAAVADPAAPTTTTTPPLSGSFVSLDHGTSGRAEVLTSLDGQRVLRIEDLATDNGPDLFVYLSTAPADGSASFDTEFVNLGALKGNVGNQNYDIPADVDLGRYATVVIWCRQFTSAFGAAPLAA